jgi:hypothetical protein
MAKAFLNRDEAKRRGNGKRHEGALRAFFGVAARMESAKGERKRPEWLKREVLENGNAYAEAMAEARATQGNLFESPTVKADLPMRRDLFDHRQE